MKVLPIDEFLSAEFHFSPEDDELLANNAEDWAALKNAIIPKVNAHPEDDIELYSFSSFGDLVPLGSQTENPILALWKSEFETPQTERTVKMPNTPITPALFDDLQDIDPDDETFFNLSLPKSQIESSLDPNGSSHEALFTTAGGKTLPSPSLTSRKRAIDILGESAALPVEQENAPPISFVGFSTASGKKVKSPSKKSLARAESIIKSSANGELSSINKTCHMSPVRAEPLGASFSTASGKKIKSPTKAAQERANAIMEEPIVDIPSCTKSLFTSASGRSLPPVSQQAVTKANKILGSVKDETPVSVMKHNGFRPFKAPSLLDPFKAMTPTRSNLNNNLFVSKLVPSPLDTTSNSLMSAREPLAVNGPLFDLSCSSKRVSLISCSQYLRAAPSHHDGRVCKDPRFINVFLSIRPNANVRWIENHLRFVIWKLNTYKRIGLPEGLINLASETFIVDQLRYRYEREINLAQRSILKKISERDDSPAPYMILIIESIEYDLNTQAMRMFVSDGWYSLETSHDIVISGLVDLGRLRVGQKVKVASAQLVADEACDILDAGERGVKLRIFGNSVRPARWHSKLGRQRTATMFTVSLSSISVDGGLVPCVQVVVVRRYPAIYTIEWESGKRRTVGQEELNQITLFSNNEEKDKIASIRMSSRIRVADASGSLKSGEAVITFWDSNSDTFARFIEGTKLQLFSLKPTIKRNKMVFLSSNKMTRIIFKGSGHEISKSIKPPLIPGQFLLLDTQEDYDINGYLMLAAADHLWVLIGEREVKLVGIKVPSNKRIGITSSRHLMIMDVSFLYLDPRHGFPVFLFTEHSQLKTDLGKHRCSPDLEFCKHQIDQARSFVHNLIRGS